jgi:hypothetical protein
VRASRKTATLLNVREKIMIRRRVVRDGCRFTVTREVDRRSTRELHQGQVLNMLQWVRPEIARFTIEGEGAEIWYCEQSTIEEQTAEVAIQKAASAPPEHTN